MDAKTRDIWQPCAIPFRSAPRESSVPENRSDPLVPSRSRFVTVRSHERPDNYRVVKAAPKTATAVAQSLPVFDEFQAASKLNYTALRRMKSDRVPFSPTAITRE